MKRLLFAFVFLFVSALSAATVLVKDGKPQGAIILGSRPTRAAQFAALELQYWISKITGAQLPIRAVPQNGDQVRLIVGLNEHTEKFGIAPFQKEEYQIAFKGNDWILAGNDAPDYGKVDYQNYKTFPEILYCYRSTTYAVYDFLEKFCGVRFYTYGEEGVCYTPRKTLDVAGEGYRRMPSMEAARYPHIQNVLKKMNVPPRENHLMLLRWRVNAMYGLANHSIYSIYPRYWDRATFKMLQPVFREKRPELFAMRKTGSTKNSSAVRRWFSDKNPPPSQLCFSQPDVLKYFTEEALQVYAGKKILGGFANTPRMAGQPFYYPFQEDDDSFWCECDACSAKRKNVPYSYSHFKFVNDLAKSVAAKNKDMGIATLAYSSSLQRPKNLRLEKNVSVQMCHSIQSWYHPQIYKYQHGIYKDWVKAEGKNRPLLLWLYMLNPAHEATHIYKYNKFFPVLYPQHAGQYFKEFLNDGISGWFGEIDFSRHALEAYIACKLSYDSSLDPKQLLSEYFRMYYGAAGKDMQEFYETLEKHVWNIKNYSPRVRAITKYNSFVYGLHTDRDNWHLGNRTILAKLDKLVRSAQQKAKTPLEKQRMQRFMNQIWNQAMEGRQEFETREKARAVPYPELTVRAIANGDNQLEKLDFSKADRVQVWTMRDNKPSPVPVEMAMMYDSKYLYVYFKEKDTYAMKNIDQNIWLNCIEFFLAEKRESDYVQVVINPKGQCEIFESVTIYGVQKFRKKEVIPCTVVSTVVQDSWTLKFALPLDRLFSKKIAPDARIYSNLFRTRRVGGEISTYMWSTIFTDLYKENLYRLAPLYFQIMPTDGALPVTLKGNTGTLPQNWKSLVSVHSNPKTAFDGKVLSVENVNKDIKHWASVYWNQMFSCQPGDEITVTFTASGKGPVYCETVLLHWHGNSARGRANKTVYLTDQPKKYTVTIVIPPKGKAAKRTPMAFRILFMVKHNMKISDVSATLKRK